MRRALSALRRNLVLVLILTLALGLCCVYLPARTSIVDQSGIQGTLAHNILAGHWFAMNGPQYEYVNVLLNRIHHFPDPADVRYPAGTDAPSFWRPFIGEVMGPALMLAGIWQVSGSERFIYGKVLQIALDLGVLLLVYRIAWLLFARRRTALIAAALYAVCFPIARQTAIVDPDIWGLYFTVAILALYLQALHSPGQRGWWLLGCGLAVGVGAFFRPNVLLLALALVLAGLPWTARGRALRDVLIIFAAAAVLVVPWTVRNSVQFHRFIPTRSGSGVVLWQGLGEIHNDFGAINDDWGTYLQVHRVRPDLEFNSPAYDEYLRGRAVHAIEHEPLFYAKLVTRRVALSTVALYESAWMYKGGESPFLYHTRTGRGPLSYVLHRPLALLESVFEPAIFALAMLALLCTWRRWRREHLLLIAVVLSALLPYWLLHFEARYALPTLPVYLLWIALGADLLAERAVRRLRATGRLQSSSRTAAATYSSS